MAAETADTDKSALQSMTKKGHNHDDEGHNHEAPGAHSHGAVFGEKTELIFSIICGVFLCIGFGLSFLNGISSTIPMVFYIAAYLFGGVFTTKEAIEGISKGKFEIDFLMLSSGSLNN